MVHDVASSDSPKRQTTRFLVTVSSILALLTKRPRKSKAAKEEDWKIDLKAPKSRPKKLLNNISSKAFGHNHKNKNNNNNNDKRGMEEEDTSEEWGNGGVWQKEILMGGKCEPLDFSGVIYYDGNGNQLSQIPPRSPRASPLPGFLARQTPQRMNY